MISLYYRTATESDKSEKNGSSSVSALFHLLVPLMKCESADMRDTIVNGLGYTNPAVFKLVYISACKILVIITLSSNDAQSMVGAQWLSG